MKQRVVWIIAAGAVVILVLVWLLVGGGGGRRAGDEGVLVSELPTPTPAPEQRVILLFAGGDGYLHPELRSVPLPGESEERVRVVLRELLAGPSGSLAPVFPYAADVNGVFIDERGKAFVDLTAPPAPLAGSHTELLLAYGVVDSVLLNCPELVAVQLLFAGREVDTLTGHLDLSRPLVLNKRFIAAS